MNDVASSSDHPRLDHESQEDVQAAPPSSDDASIVQQRQRLQKAQRDDLLKHLIRNVDIVIYAQLSVLYYMDCTISRFIIRGLPHWFYFTPKPSIFPPLPPTQHPYITVIFLTNAICMLSHLFMAPLIASEATRGYLHGSVLIDFVGQKSPVQRWRLLGLDFLVLGLQLLMLGLTVEKKGVDKGNCGVVEEGVVTEARQDHDSEERGMLRRGPEESDDIELQELQHTSSGRTGGDEDRERDELLAANIETDRAVHHPLDPYYTGEHVIADLHILGTIRSQWKAKGATVVDSGSTTASGTQAAAVAAAARRTFTFGLGRGVQTEA